MPISESQLETWSHQGAVATAKATADSIRNALNSYTRWPKSVQFEVFLQGSYKNDTNIRGDSDVDVVAKLNSTFYSNLTELQKRLLRLTSTVYGWPNFRTDALEALRAYYGRTAVTEGNHAITVNAGTGRLAGDVVVCAQYRQYKTASQYDYVEGMTFWSRNDSRQIVNFPKVHYEHGVAKNSVTHTNGRYKRTVRTFKNARTYLADRGAISDSLAPSYFLECLMYNVPDDKFGNSLQDTFVGTFNWLWNAVGTNPFVCQNEQSALFGPAPEQWDVGKARQLLQALLNLWNDR